MEAVCPNQIKVIDIGGGLSTTYIEVSYGVFFLPWILYSFHNQIVVFFLQKEEPKEFAYSEYRKKLEEIVPQLLSGRFVISITMRIYSFVCVSSSGLFILSLMLSSLDSTRLNFSPNQL